MLDKDPNNVDDLIYMVKKFPNKVTDLKRNAREGTSNNKPFRSVYIKPNQKPRELTNFNLDKIGMDNKCTYHYSNHS